jgi:hypothetical protein
MENALPPEIAQGATLLGNEYGWSVALFPDALDGAAACGYACLGGQFQFRLDDGTTCEMYWLDADPGDRDNGESWAAYARRSCAEVLKKFQQLISATDFRKEAASWPLQIDGERDLVFVAYFVQESEWDRLSVHKP